MTDGAKQFLAGLSEIVSAANASLNPPQEIPIGDNLVKASVSVWDDVLNFERKATIRCKINGESIEITEPATKDCAAFLIEKLAKEIAKIAFRDAEKHINRSIL